MKVAIIGAGFGGLSAAAYLAKAGCEVHVFEKNGQPGGRAQVVERDDFIFDTGPSWYMMPDVFEEFFSDFGKKPEDYYQLSRLLPNYKVYFDDSEQSVRPVPAVYRDFDTLEPGAGKKLDRYLTVVEREYHKVRDQLLVIDGLSLKSLSNPSALEMLLNPQLLGSFHQRISRVVKDDKLRRIMEFMVIFLGGAPKDIPALYGMLNWADFGQGIWYPHGGFGAVVRAFESLAKEQGAVFHYEASVEAIVTEDKHATAVVVNGEKLEFHAIVANADYCHVETELLPESGRSYGKKYWQDKTLSPSAVVALLGVTRKLPLEHHSLFFDGPWEAGFEDVFKKHQLGEKPLFYVTSPSRTDKTVAPEGCENLVVVIPVSNQADVDASLTARLTDEAIARIEKRTGIIFRDQLAVKEVLPPSYYGSQFNAYRNNAFGLSQTLLQSGPLRPRIRSKKLPNLYYVGQYTNPGTGVPLVVLSGKVVAGVLTTS